MRPDVELLVLILTWKEELVPVPRVEMPELGLRVRGCDPTPLLLKPDLTHGAFH